MLRTDELVPAGRWVTPLGAPVRFDASFFLIESPAGWEPQPDPTEVGACAWLTPASVLDDLSSGARSMAPPTIEVLHKLSACDSVARALSVIPKTDRSAVMDPIQLSPLVRVLLAPNPGPMTGPGTNTYIVGGPGDCIVIDPAVEDREFIERIRAASPGISSILITHRHPDHIGGVVMLSAHTGAPVRAFGPDPIAGLDVEPLADGDTVVFPGGRLIALHTPGHASDHLCFSMEGTATLFSGDAILGEGTAVIAPPDGNMADYMRTLRRLFELDLDRIFPGHWRPLMGGRRVIEGYIDHREARGLSILSAIRQGAKNLDAIVEQVYVDTPTAMHGAASYSALAHLEMMEGEGLVTRAGDGWSIN